MTTKTIPEYLEDERQKGRDAQQSMEEEATRIQPLNHGHHRTAKQPKLELRSSVKATPKARKKTASLEQATLNEKEGYKSSQGSLTSHGFCDCVESLSDT
jgi:hypothetical protein